MPIGLALNADELMSASPPRMCCGTMCMFCQAHRNGVKGLDSSISTFWSSTTFRFLIRSKPLRERIATFGFMIVW